nr:C80 family cysteine peptidase [Candidatus Hamiltonella defensa]
MTQEQFPRNSFIPPHESDVPIRRTKRTPTGFVPVDQWEVESVTTRSDGGSTRYAGQLIIQLENDPMIRRAATRLAEKHPGSVLVQLDQKNTYRVVSGFPNTLEGKLRWQIVGHGSGVHTSETPPVIGTLSGMDPVYLAQLLKKFNQHFSTTYHIDSTPNRISLVGCELARPNSPNFATQFAHEMKSVGILADISARTELVAVAQRSGKKLTTKTKLTNPAQTAGKTLLLGWNKNGELIYKKHSSAFRLLSPVLETWAPQHFTDPKRNSKEFRYLVYSSSMKDLLSRKGIFSKNIRDKLRQSDVMSASILSNQTLRGHTVGVILEVPEQNILAAAPDENIIEPKLDGVIKISDDEHPAVKTHGLQKINQMINGEQLPPTNSTPLSSLARNGLLNQLFSYPQRVSVPDEIIHKTITRNTVLVTGRPDINIYPHYPVTKDIKITGLFLTGFDTPRNTGGAQGFSSSEQLTSKNFQLLREAARDITQELNIELKVIKIRPGTDGPKGHQRNITPQINQDKSIMPLDMAPDQKNLGASLIENLKRVSILINDLSSRKGRVFKPSDLKLLTEFFHLSSGELDWRKLYQTLSDPLLYSQFMSQIQSLMQLSDTHDQFMSVTGQSALKRTADWDNFVVDNLLHWNERIKKHNHTPEWHFQIHPSMQAIYMIDGSDLAQQKAKKVSLAYLSMLTLENKNLRLKLLNAFQTHAEINEQKIFAPLDDEGAKIFRHLIHQLEDTSVFMEKGPRNLSQFFNILASQTAGYYQLRMGGHILTIAKRQGKNQQTNWYLYDANFGEIQITIPDVEKTSTPIRLLLHDYFTRLKNLPQQDNRAVVFDVYQLNADKLSASIPFKKLKQFISNTNNLLSSSSTHEPIKLQKNRVSQTMSRTYHTVGLIGQAHQGLSWIRSVTCLSHYWRRRSAEQLNPSQKQALDFEAQLAIAGLLYDVKSTFIESGFRKQGSHLIQKFSSQGVRVFASRIQRLQYAAGLKLARYGGAFLNMLGTGFDIYQAQKAATELTTETDPDVRQDLKVSLALSSLGASIGIASGLALLTLTGKMALIAGAMGIALGILTAVVGGIYFSVRQVQEIERYTTLTGLQKLRTGWLKFWGAEVDIEITNQVTKVKAEIEAKKNLHRQCQNTFQALLDSDEQIEAVYYSSGNIILGEYRYKKLTGKRWTMLGNRLIPQCEYLFINNIKDKILPSQALGILSNYQTQKWQNQPLYVDLRLENSEYKFYDIERLSPTDDQISLDTDAHSESILSLKRPVEPSSFSSPSASVVKSNTADFKNPARIYFFLGDGDDEVVGHPEKRNIFDIGAGVKNFKGGNQSDMFIFNGTSAPAQPCVFDGIKGVNFLVANKKPSQGGYYVNLKEASFHFTHEPQKIAKLKNIDHVETCADTDDVILGNAQANILNGKGGKDKLMGFDGNDILVAQSGKLDGGKGTDSYRVLQNTRSEPAILIIEEEEDPEEFSHVFLDYAVTQIISIKRIKQHVVIELRNDNQSITTLTLFYLYRSVEPKTRKLTQQYIFYTQDGVIFTGFPPEIAVNPDEEEPEPLTLMAQYS